MMGLGYISKQIYSFQNYDKLLKILQITQTTNFEIDTNEQIIKYTIDRKQWIRLNDLMEWIQIKFIRFHFGQLLDLFEKLLDYVQYLQQQNIDHQYLDSNRIWLVLRKESQYPSIIHQHLLYDIIFTGYQCPFYENTNLKGMEAQQKIQNIILDIVKQFIQLQVGLVKKEKEKKAEEILIFTKLKKTLKMGFIIPSLELVKSLKSKYEYSNKTQMISFDKETATIFSQRRNREDNVKASFGNYLKQLNQFQDQTILEEAIQRLTKLQMETLDELGIYKISEFNMDSFIREIKKIQYLSEAEFISLIESIIKKEIEKQIKQTQNQFKFEFSQEEITRMQVEILDAHKSKKVFLYFQNSNYYRLQNHQNESKLVIVSQYILDLVQERFNLCLELKVIKLILELI